MNSQHAFARHFAHAALALALTCAGGFAAPVQANTVDLSPAPPNLTTSVPPNVALTFDDSGSMSFGYMPDTADGYCGWKYASSNYNKIYYNPQITYNPPLDKNGDPFADVDFNAAPEDGYHTALGFGSTTVDLATDYRPTLEWDRDGYHDNNTIRSSCVPDSVKLIKSLHEGVTVTGGVYTYTCGLFDGEYAHDDDHYDDAMCEIPPELDLHCDNDDLDNCVVHPPGSYDYIYDYHNDAYYAKSDGTIVDLTTITTGATVNGTTRTVAQEQQNFANWYSYYRTRNLMTKTAVTQAFGNLQAPIQLVWQTIWGHSKSRPWSQGLATSDPIGPYQSVVDSDGNVVTTGNKSDFFDWLLKIESSNSTPDRTASQRVGAYFTMPEASDRKGTATDPYWNRLSGVDTQELACRQNYHVLVTDGYWNEANSLVSTPGKSADSMDNTPDGRATKIDESSIYWNVDGTNSKSLANIAYDYWATDLAPGIDNDVAPYLSDSTHDLFNGAFDPSDPWANNEIYFNPANDPATWQHLDQFVVTLGMDGELQQPQDYEALRLGAKKWPQPEGDQPSALDDMWHAAITSRGAYFSASNPAALANHLAQIINSIASRSSSAVANTVNSGVATSKSVTYQGLFNPADWSGSVKAFKQVLQPIEDAEGHVIGSKLAIGAELWDAGALLTADCSDGCDRVILTSFDVGADKGVPFKWNSLSDDEKAALNANPATGDSDGYGSDRLDWLRGDDSKEGSELRTRASVMGAVIRSQPLYVAYPDSGYRNAFPDNSDGTTAAENATGVTQTYEQFVAAHKTRTPVLYVGANDGMLHALDAATGEELFAYVPASAYWRSPPVAAADPAPAEPGIPLLSTLTAKTNFSFLPTVDNTPVKRDVFFDSAWHTLLVGTLGMGGRGVYALDVTNPDDVTDTDASAKATVLWEFNSTSTGGADMGYTYGQPEIARLATGKWAVLVPGGYFPQDPLDPNHYAAGAANTFSSLFVLDAQTGALIRELKTSDAKVGNDVTSYGLSTPVLGDYDDNQVDDVAFAGDLMGNLWRFDLSDPEPANWQMDLVYQGNVDTNGEPLQPITVKPRLFPDPATNQFMVVFGTGKYLGADDRLRLGTPTQAIYGIREQGASGSTNFPADYYPVKHDQLVTHTMTVDPDGVHWLTNEALPGTDANGIIITGWEIPLDAREGERVVQRAGALFNTNQALITTLIPSGNDPCNPNRTGAQILISATSGGAGAGLPALGSPTKDADGNIVKAAVGKNFPPAPPGTGGGIPETLPSTSDSGSGQPVIVEPGGCRGITASGMNVPMACWRRRSWKVLLGNP